MITFVLVTIKEADPLTRGGLDGSITELMIARSLGIPGRPTRRWVPISVHWLPPHAGWYNANVDGSVSSAPGYMYTGAIFRNSIGFFAGAFYTRLGRGFPLEAKLAVILHSIIYAQAQGAMQAASTMMIMYSHIFREANRAAGCLAKLHRDGRRSSLSLPDGFVPKEGFPLGRFLMGLQPLDRVVI
ncbi:hypothetical protein ACS0TY_021286 [Phlomoides rotata]